MGDGIIPVVEWVRWGDVPTWVAAFGTAGAVVVALGLAQRDSRRRAREERRRQAEMVTAWVVGGTVGSFEAGPGVLVRISNASRQLVYRVIASTGDAARGVLPTDPDEGRQFLAEAPPGAIELTMAWPGPGMFARPGVELAFQDAAGRRWVRKMDGTLLEIDQDQASYYGLSEPLSWVAAPPPVTLP